MSVYENSDAPDSDEMGKGTPKPKRVPGALKGKIWIKDDDTFDDPLEDFQREMEEGEIFPPE